MVIDYIVRENDGKTIIIPSLDDSDKRILRKQTTDNGVFNFFMDILTPDYFNKTPSLFSEYYHCNEEVRSHMTSRKSNNVLKTHINIVDKNGRRISGHPKNSINKSAGIRISSSITRTSDTNYKQGLLNWYKYTKPIFKQIEGEGSCRQLVYEDITTAILHGISLDKLKSKYKSKAKPFIISSGTGIEFYFFNPEKNRLILASREFNKFMKYIELNKVAIMNIASLRISAMDITKYNFDEQSEGGLFISNKSEEFISKSDEILSNLPNENFSKLESLIYTTGSSLHGWD